MHGATIKIYMNCVENSEYLGIPEGGTYSYTGFL